MFIFDTSPERPVSHTGGRIVHAWLKLPDGGIKFGALRNLSTAAALDALPGCDLIAHWDDDDWYAPERLARQVGVMAETGKCVTGFHSGKFTDGERWWKYHGIPNFAMDASLMYRPTWFRQVKFNANTHIGPETEWTARASRANELAAIDGAVDLLPQRSAGDLMVVRCHKSNTSPKIPGGNWQRLFDIPLRSN